MTLKPLGPSFCLLQFHFFGHTVTESYGNYEVSPIFNSRIGLLYKKTNNDNNNNKKHLKTIKITSHGN